MKLMLPSMPTEKYSIEWGRERSKENAELSAFLFPAARFHLPFCSTSEDNPARYSIAGSRYQIESVMVSRADPKVDYAFKHLFGRPQNVLLLIDLLNAILQLAPDKLIRSLEILNPFNDKEATDDKLSILDIKARDQLGRQFNIEMQLLAYGAYLPRALYYWARLHQGQLQEGQDYSELRPTIVICLVDTPLFAQSPSYHHVFELRERASSLLFTDQLALHIWNCRSSPKRRGN